MQVPDTGITEVPPEQTQLEPLQNQNVDMIESSPEPEPIVDLAEEYGYRRAPASNPDMELKRLQEAQAQYLPPEEEEARLVEKRDKADSAYQQIRNIVRGATPTEPGKEVVTFTLDLFGDAIEDTGNMAIEVAEGISHAFGGDLSIDRIEAVSNAMPEGEFRQAAIDTIQILASYATGVKHAQRIIKAPSKIKRGVDFGIKTVSTFVSEATFNDTMDMMMSESMLKNSPYLGDLVRYIESDIGDDTLLDSAKTGMYGVLDTVMMDNVIRMAKVLKNTRLAQKVFEKVTPDFLKRKAGGKAADVVGDEIPQVSPEMIKEGALDAVMGSPSMKVKKEAIYRKDGSLVRQPLPPTPDDMPMDIPSIIGDRKSTQYNPNRLTTVDAGGNPVRKNLMRLDTTDEIRLALSEFMEENADSLGKAVLDNKMLQDAALAHNMTVDKLVKWSQRKGLKLGEVLAARQIQLDAIEQFDVLSQMYRAGEIPLEIIAAAHENLRLVTRVVSDMESLSSALLRESGVDIAVRQGAAAETVMAMEAKKQRARSVKEILQKGEDLIRLHGDEAYDVIAREIGKIDNRSLSNIIGRSVNQMADLAIQISYANMLSSPRLLVRNAIGAMTMMGGHIAETITASGIGALRLRGQNYMSKVLGSPKPIQDKVDLQEALVMTHGMMQGAAEAFILTSKVVGRKVSFGRLFPESAEGTRGFKGIRPDRDRTPHAALEVPVDGHPVVKAIKAVMTIPGRSIKLQDDAIKHTALRMKLNQEAYREAQALMRQGATAEQAAIQAEYVTKGLISKERMGKLMEFGEEMTLTNKPANAILSEMTDYKKGLPQKLIFLAVPFARAGTNALTYAFDRIPLANLAIKANREAIKHRALDPRAFDMYLAKSTTYSVGLGTVAYYLNSQDMIVGSRPKRDGTLFSQAGIQEHSIRVGDKTISYLPETPMGAVLAGVHTLNEIIDILQDENSDYIADVATVIGLSFQEVLQPEFFAEGVSLLLEGIMAQDTDMVEKALEFGMDIAGRVIFPASSAARALTRSGEDGQYVMDTNPGRLLTNMFQALINEAMNIYAPEGLPYRRDFFGHKIEHSKGLGGWISPFNFKTANSDPVMREMINLAGNFENKIPKKHKVADTRFEEYELFPAPSRGLRTLDDMPGLQSKRLNNNEYERLSLYSAGINPDTEKPLTEGYTYRDAMERLFNSPEYKNYSLENKRLQAHMLHRAYMQMGTAYMKGEVLDSKTTKEIVDAFMERLKDDDGLPPISF